MKLVIPAAIVLLTACGSNPAETPALVTDETVNSDSAETTVTENQHQFNPHPSICMKDRNGLKQGYWITYGKDFPELGYPAEAKIDEGHYKDDQKHGEWIYYNKESNVDSIVTYDNGKWLKTEI